MSPDQPPGEPVDAERPARRVVASYERYGDAQRAVDRLADSGFAVERAAIAAQGLRFVEEVTGRRTAARAAAEGSSQGAVVGALVGLFLGLFETNTAGLVLPLYGLVIGLLLGALAGLVLHAATSRGPDFSSVGHMEADHYDVLVDEPVADEALSLLGDRASTEQPG